MEFVVTLLAGVVLCGVLYGVTYPMASWFYRRGVDRDVPRGAVQLMCVVGLLLVLFAGSVVRSVVGF